MSLKDLLAYQKADGECKKIEKELNGTQKKEMERIKAEFDKAKASSEKAEAHAKKIEQLYNEALAKLADIERKIEQTAAKLEDAEDKGAVIAELKELKTALDEIEGKVNTYKVESEKALSVYTKAHAVAKSAKAAYPKAKEAYQAIEKQYGEQYEKAKAERDSLRAKVDPKLLEQYDGLVAQNIPRPFVPANGDDKNMSCGGCFMALNHTLIDELKEKGFCHCDNCKRIVYKG